VTQPVLSSPSVGNGYLETPSISDLLSLLLLLILLLLLPLLTTGCKPNIQPCSDSMGVGLPSFPWPTYCSSAGQHVLTTSAGQHVLTTCAGAKHSIFTAVSVTVT